jgi:hypothetical protein
MGQYIYVHHRSLADDARVVFISCRGHQVIKNMSLQPKEAEMANAMAVSIDDEQCSIRQSLETWRSFAAPSGGFSLCFYSGRIALFCYLNAPSKSYQLLACISNKDFL